MGLLIVLFGWNDVISLRAEEPRRAIVAMEMYLSGEYIAPHINGWPYYNKPPVFNWVLVFFMWVFDSFEEWVVRIPSIISFLLIGLISYNINKQYFSKKIALLSSLFFLTSADLLFFGSINAGEIDIFFSLIVYLQTIATFYFYNKKKYFKMFLYSYILAAVGTLIKGPPSIAFQALTILGWLLYKKEYKLLFSIKHITSGIVFLVIVAGYFMVYNINQDGIGFAFRLFKEASMRTGLEHSFSDTVVGTLTFPLYLAKLLLPWSLFVIFWFKKGFWSTIKKNQLLLFSAIFLITNIWIYWLTPDHKARYLYMFFPYITLLLAYFFVEQKEKSKTLSKVFHYVFLSAMILVSLGFVSTLFISELAIIKAIYFKVILLLILSIVTIFSYLKVSKLRIYCFILFIVCCRLAINFFYLPMVRKYEYRDNYYEQKVADMLTITNNEPIYWYSKKPYNLKFNAAIGSFVIEKVSLKSARLIAYQTPYYITKGTNEVMQFHTTMENNRYYLTPTTEIDTNDFKIHYSFTDKFIARTLVLVEKN